MKNRGKRIFLLVVLLALSTLIYLPGIYGPFLFDDHTNILGNTFIKLESLDSRSIREAAFSLSAGPLDRPIAMASFALNYYFSEGFSSSAPYKLTNIVIHAINGLLIFWFVHLILQRRTQIVAKRNLPNDKIQKTPLFLAAAISLLWLVHPIQLTSVLYIVQRMTSLSALFTLIGLILYLKGRVQILNGRTQGLWLILAGVFGCGTLGMLSKENAILLPIFIFVLEFLLFSRVEPWSSWKHLPPHTRQLIIVGGIAGIASLAAFSVSYALPGYANRNFTMLERLMTEGRVLFFYLSLIFVPRINQFGLFHDDIPISTSLVDPFTTLLSLIGIVTLISLAIYYRRKYVLLSLGILWFFTGHLLESTIFPLEIAHEHRNYLASLGVIFIIAEVTSSASIKFKQWQWWLILPVLSAVFASITFTRAIQWSNPSQHYIYEVIHHPDSPATQMGLAMVLMNYGKFSESLQPFHRAAELEPSEAGALINMMAMQASNKMKLDELDHREILRRLGMFPTSATTIQSLQNAISCILDKCTTLQPYLEEWLRTLIDNRSLRYSDKSYYYYLLGRVLLGEGKLNPAIEAYRQSYELDAKFLHPLFDLAEIYIQLDMPDSAKIMLHELRKANQISSHPRFNEIAELEKKIADIKQGKLRKAE